MITGLMWEMSIDAQTLIKLVKFLKRGKAPGPDTIHNEVLMSQSIPTGSIPPRATPGKIFLSERIPATRAIFLSNSLPRGKKMMVEFPGVGQNFPKLEETAL